MAVSGRVRAQSRLCLRFVLRFLRAFLKIIEKDADDTRLARQRRQFADVSLSCGVDAPQHDAIEKSMAFVNYLPFEMEQ